MGIHHDLYSLSKVSRVTKTMRWARYVAYLGKRCTGVSEEKGDGKRHVEDHEVDGEKRLPAHTWDNSTLTFSPNIVWGSGKRHGPAV
jgi:hypothetical protein